MTFHWISQELRQTSIRISTGSWNHIERCVKDLQYKMQRFNSKQQIKCWNCTANHPWTQLFCDHMPLLPHPSVDLTHHKLLNQPSDPLIIRCYFCCGSLAFRSLSCRVKHGFNNNTVTIWQSSWLPFATSEISTFLAPCVTLRQLRGAVPLVKWRHAPLVIFLARVKG